MNAGLTLNRQWSLKPSSARDRPARSRAIRPAWSVACDRCWPIKLPATWSACGGLVAEHLRLGTWDLLCGWTGQPTLRPEPRWAMQLVHEAAICTTGVRAQRTLQQRGGFELANGLPFVATDPPQADHP